MTLSKMKADSGRAKLPVFFFTRWKYLCGEGIRCDNLWSKLKISKTSHVQPPWQELTADRARELNLAFVFATDSFLGF